MLPTTAFSLKQLLQNLPTGIHPQEGIRKIMWKLATRGEYFLSLLLTTNAHMPLKITFLSRCTFLMILTALLLSVNIKCSVRTGYWFN